MMTTAPKHSYKVTSHQAPQSFTDYSEGRTTHKPFIAHNTSIRTPLDPFTTNLPPPFDLHNYQTCHKPSTTPNPSSATHPPGNLTPFVASTHHQTLSRRRGTEQQERELRAAEKRRGLSVASDGSQRCEGRQRIGRRRESKKDGAPEEGIEEKRELKGDWKGGREKERRTGYARGGN
ncbi:hypothetical protein Droror1_Dr00016467 [Drosera rotundifolia]